MVPTGKRGRPKRDPNAAPYSGYRLKYENKKAELAQAREQISLLKKDLSDKEAQIRSLELQIQACQSKWSAFCSDLRTLVASAPEGEAPYESCKTRKRAQKNQRNSPEVQE